MYRTGLDLMRQVIGEKDFYDAADHRSVGLPVVIACNYCHTSMAGAAALFDAGGYAWCADHAEGE